MPKALAIQMNWQFTGSAAIMQVEHTADCFGGAWFKSALSTEVWHPRHIWLEAAFQFSEELALNGETYVVRVTEFSATCTGRWSTSWTEPVQGQSLEEGRYVGISKHWCHCPCAPWNVDLETADPPVGWTNIACFYSVCKEDQCARQCHMLLLSPERRRQSLGSAGIHFRWKWWGQQPGHKKCFDLCANQPGLDWVNLRLWEKCAGVQDAPGACNTHSTVRLGGS